MKAPADQQWKHLIERVFNPLSIKSLSESMSEASIDRGGLVLKLPSIESKTSLEVFCCDNGQRVFTSRDINLSMQLLDLMRHSRNLYDAHELGVQQERQRIQRDLHDDVAARLLSLIHQSHEPLISRAASNAMRGLRDVIHLLGAEEALLEDVLTDLESIAREQLAGLDIRLDWRAPAADWPEIRLNSQQHINLRRILRETLANALKHARPLHCRIEVFLEGKQLSLKICSDGNASDPSCWVPGRGLNNIKSRIAEMGGSHRWVIEQPAEGGRYCCLETHILLSDHATAQRHSSD
jgi:two-component system, NarL family, sensor histidine kinase DevS